MSYAGRVERAKRTNSFLADPVAKFISPTVPRSGYCRVSLINATNWLTQFDYPQP
jgi:hypothetical protein